MTDELNLLGHPSIDDKRAFEQWYTTHTFDYELQPIGSRECSLQRKAWIASRAEPVRKVRLPEPYGHHVADSFYDVEDVHEALKAAGIEVEND